DASFTYQITDGDGDTDTAVQPITVTDGTALTVTKNAVIDVNEEGLDNANALGSAEGAAGGTELSTLERSSDTVSFLAGSDAITGMVFGSTAGMTVNVNGIAGPDITWTTVNSTTITGTINGIVAITITLTPPALPVAPGGTATGTVNVVLSDNFPHVNANGENTITLNGLIVTASEADGTTANASGTITVVDDVPAIGNFSDFTVPNAIGVTAGPTNTGFISGADDWSSINITGEAIAGLTYKTLVTNPDGSVTLSAYETGGDPDDLVFSYTVFEDGSQSFNLIKPEAETLITQSLANLSPGGPTPFLELPDFSIEFSGSDNGVNSSTQGMGIDNQFIDPGEVLTLEFYNPGIAGDDDPDNILDSATERLISSLDFTNNSNGGGTLNWIVYNTIDGTTDSGSVTEVNGHYVIDAAIDFNKIEITGGDDANARLTSVVIGERLLPDGEDITFTVTGTDGDGDVTSSDDITVTIDPEVAPIVPFQEFSALAGDIATLQTATSESDTLLATDDADVFVWALADNTVQGDTIVGFNTEADAINIADLLADTVDTTDFSSYLNVSVDGASTVLRISSTGDFEHADQVITVQDVNLFEGVDFSDTAALSTALQNMVDSGKLITD
ncbi:MAG: type I secretion C-terminal target domain-containing protein, partial [Ignavibacteriae bacterium]